MKIIWISLLLEILILNLIKLFATDFESVSILAVFVHALFVIIILLSYKNRIKFLFLGAFLARFGFMLWDGFAKHIFMLPHSGLDSVGYYHSALRISQDISLLSENVYGGLYSKIIGFLYYIIGPLQLFAQYINVLLGLSVVCILYKILIMLDLENKIIRTVILIAAFFPNSLILSGIFLREMFITFFVTVSLYYFIKWYKFNGIKDMIFSFIYLGIASMFHSGVIGIGIGYAFMYLFYKRSKNSFQFSIRTIFVFSLILLISSIIFTQYNDIFLGKFKDVEEMSDVYSTANSRRGGSAYLTNMTINNPVQLMLFSPIKMFYFLTSPLPMNWRGFMDIFTFFSDSILYLTIILYVLKNKKYFKDNKPLIIGILISLIGVTFIFGIGVSNAGTAIRHRQKIISIFLVLFAVLLSSKRKELKKINEQLVRKNVV